METSELLAARYGSSARNIADIPGKADVVLETLLGHRSIRSYRPDPLPPGTLERLVAAAQSTASSSNLQAWSVVALQEAERKWDASLLCGNQDFIRQAPLFLIFCADLSRLMQVSEQAEMGGAALDFMEMFLIAVIDASLAAQNAAIAAESLGLGICYVGAARNNPGELAQFLHLPPRVFALFGMTVGVPTEPITAAVKPRLPQSALLHREFYDTSAQLPAVAEYDRVMQEFYESQQMPVTGGWSSHSARRVAARESLGGRDTLRQIIEELGFPLR